MDRERLQEAILRERVAEGRAEGKAEGLTEGLAKGMAEGMLARGMSVTEVAELTGLSAKEIEAL